MRHVGDAARRAGCREPHGAQDHTPSRHVPPFRRIRAARRTCTVQRYRASRFPMSQPGEWPGGTGGRRC
jgi:hypothetical protein